MPRLSTALCLLALAACYHPPGSASGPGSTTGPGGTSGSAGATGAAGSTGSAGATSGTASGGASTGSGGTGSGTHGGSSGGNSSGGSAGGTSGGFDCSVNVGCPVGSVCELQVSTCPSAFGWSETSPGGHCTPYRTCGSSNGCQGQPCSSDADCDLSEACAQGTCQAEFCPASIPYCDPSCTLVSRAHSCAVDCICPSCPVDSDAGSGNCDVNNPCPPGSACAYQTSPCPGSGGGSVDLGGVCQGYRDCSGPGSGCAGQACSSDQDCGLYEQCGASGACEGVPCPDLWPGPCPTGCNYVDPPHSCLTQCICPVCPSPDAGAGCGLYQPCGSGLACDEAFGSCPGSQASVELSGQCVPDCGNGGPCPAPGQPCASNWDCPSYEACQSGTCAPLACPPVANLCPSDCTLYEPPHGCLICVCYSCPGDADAGPPDADAGPIPGLDGGAPTWDGGACDPANCAYDCCGDQCVYLQNDTQNCGWCGHACALGEYCSSGTCQASLDGGVTSCALDGGSGVVCGGWGGLCCPDNQICCQVNVSVTVFECADPAVGCPIGCPMCL